MQLKKRDVNVGKAVFEGDIKTGAEGSIIVPDVKPDILKVLQVEAETFLCEKQIDDGKLILKGKVKVNVLYVPESGEDCVQCINGCFEFCETLKKTEFSAGMQLVACCDAEKVGYKIINSRKIGIDAQVVINVQVLANQSCSFVSEIEEDCAEVKKSCVNIRSIGVCRDFSFRIDEVMELPSGKCGIKEILKSNVMIFEKEYRALQGKLVIKGKANASVLYSDENDRCDHVDFELPFTEVFDADELSEGAECDIMYQIGETDFSLTANHGDEGKSMALSAEISVCVKSECVEEIPIVSDCYFTNQDCDISMEEIEAEEIAARPMFSAVMKELMQKEENAPDIMSVYTAVAKPYITATQMQNGRIAVSGKSVVYVLYTTENPQIPVCSINEEVPFSYMIDCENISRGDEVLLNVECEHISYTISSQNAVEVRCGLGITGKVIKKSSVRVITNIETRELAKKDSSIVIYFAKKGDSIWDIAKRYHVKCESILSCNGLDEGASVIQGEKLIIPVTNS
ncbi:MAG: DUF3794 domain-containing protein [Clostridia bacterium]|nr:DUF3794 domain-containing protein [Clostridia bacterium]MBP3360110.1 DUF3794 domain-containing protein [Clostridia bacterium]